MKPFLNRLRGLTKGFAKRPVYFGVVGLALVLVAAGGAMAIKAGVTADKQAKQQAQYERQLQAAVDTSTGAPRDGRDPASQGQNGLAAAASRPAGPGQQTDTPAAGVVEDHSGHDVKAETVLVDSKNSGVGNNGCLIDYGKPGEQCLPTPGTGQAVSCDHVRKYFAHGIAVTGQDRFKLDANGDKTACGHDE